MLTSALRLSHWTVVMENFVCFFQLRLSVGWRKRYGEMCYSLRFTIAYNLQMQENWFSVEISNYSRSLERNDFSRVSRLQYPQSLKLKYELRIAKVHRVGGNEHQMLPMNSMLLHRTDEKNISPRISPDVAKIYLIRSEHSLNGKIAN